MKNKERFERIVFFGSVFFIVIGIVMLINSYDPGRKNETISVGAVLIGAADDGGWNQNHYEGIRRACEENGCELFYKDKIPDDKDSFLDAVSELVDQGCSCIFLTSYGYGEHLYLAEQEYPKIAFYFISGKGEAENCTTYCARMYQARYLSGIVAGSKTETGVLGYVTAMPNPETIRTINAFALGVRKSNPSAKILVVYTGNWNDSKAEEQAVKNLNEAGADVITHFLDRSYIIELADEMGMYTIGYDQVEGEYSERFLTAAVVNWDTLYTEVLGDFLSGRANFSKNYWLGLSDGVVSLYPYSKLVTEETKELVASEEERIKTGLDVFSGEIYDNAGEQRCGEKERIGDDELFHNLDWYVEGVEIYE